MTPVLITAPTASPVSLEELKRHLRRRPDDTDEDSLIEEYATEAVAYLDGWSGVLGRCIMPQTWSVLAAAGEVILPMPNTTNIVAAYASGDVVLTPIATPLGPCVTVAEACLLTFTCEMPVTLLPLAKRAVKLLVGHAMDNREAVGPAMHETPLAVGAIISSIGWRKV